jgi:hypothetical protein
MWDFTEEAKRIRGAGVVPARPSEFILKVYVQPALRD